LLTIQRTVTSLELQWNDPLYSQLTYTWNLMIYDSLVTGYCCWCYASAALKRILAERPEVLVTTSALLMHAYQERASTSFCHKTIGENDRMMDCIL